MTDSQNDRAHDSRAAGGRRALLWVLASSLAAFVVWKLHGAHVDWAGIGRAVEAADGWELLGAIAVVWSIYVLRAARWSIFLRAAPDEGRPVAWWQLIPSQFAGFAGLAIFGRLGELIRPYLVARRTERSFASQIGVVAVERIFDLLAFATIFAVTLMVAPGLERLPHGEALHRLGYAAAGMAAALVLVVGAIRANGERVARGLGRFAARFSLRAGPSVEHKVRSFESGLNAIRGWRELLGAAGLSLAIWGSNAFAYLLVMHALPGATSALRLPAMVLLMGFSIAGSVVQLPGVGGGSQVSTISAMRLLLGVPAEMAVSAGLLLWLVTFMSVIAPGLVFARMEGVSLRGVARESKGSPR